MIIQADIVVVDGNRTPDLSGFPDGIAWVRRRVISPDRWEIEIVDDEYLQSIAEARLADAEQRAITAESRLERLLKAMEESELREIREAAEKTREGDNGGGDNGGDDGGGGR